MGRKAHAKKLRRQDGERVGHIRQQTRKVAAGLVGARADALANAAIRGRQSADIARLRLRVAQLLRANTRLRPWAIRGRWPWWKWVGVVLRARMRGFVAMRTAESTEPRVIWRNFSATVTEETGQ